MHLTSLICSNTLGTKKVWYKRRDLLKVTHLYPLSTNTQRISPLERWDLRVYLKTLLAFAKLNSWALQGVKLCPSYFCLSSVTQVLSKCRMMKMMMISRPKKSTCLFISIVVQSLSRVQLFVTPWTAATSWTASHQASLSFTISWSLFKLMSIE